MMVIGRSSWLPVALALLACTHACTARDDDADEPWAPASSEGASDHGSGVPSSGEPSSSEGDDPVVADVHDSGPAGPDVTPVREPFTMVMVPDTQYTVQNWPNDYFAQMNWIADHVDEMDTRFVIHVGDLQEAAHRVADWQNAAAGLDYLQGKVPYAIAIGNHDFDAWANGGDKHANIEADRSTSLFNQYVPRSRMTAYHTFGDTYPTSLNDNSYHVLAAGGTDWLILTLKYRPIEEELAWARTVVEAHPDHQVIVNTHEYLSRTSGPSAAGDEIWEGLGKRYSNISMILSGHLTGANRRIATGDHGNSVIEILADYQSTTNREANSYLRIMRFDPNAATIEVETYSPALDKYLIGDEAIECPPWNCPVTGGHEFVLENVPFPPASGEWWTTRDVGSCLGVESASIENGARVVQSSCSGRANQQWRVRDTGDGHAHLYVRHANKCLNVSGESLEDGAEIIVWRCGPEHNQQWQVQDADDGHVRLVARHSGKCLELSGDDGDGAPFIQSSCSDSTRQQFVRTPF